MYGCAVGAEGSAVGSGRDFGNALNKGGHRCRPGFSYMEKIMRLPLALSIVAILSCPMMVEGWVKRLADVIPEGWPSNPRGLAQEQWFRPRRYKPNRDFHFGLMVHPRSAGADHSRLRPSLAGADAQGTSTPPGTSSAAVRGAGQSAGPVGVRFTNLTSTDQLVACRGRGCTRTLKAPVVASARAPGTTRTACSSQSMLTNCTCTTEPSRRLPR